MKMEALVFHLNQKKMEQIKTTRPKFYDTTKENQQYITIEPLEKDVLNVNTDGETLFLITREEDYFTPSFDELFQGYELQISENNIVWNHLDFTFKDTPLIKYCKIRTKWLDQKDIESKGWKFIEKENNVLYFDKADFVLNYDTVTKNLVINQVGEMRVLGMYYGECKSVNEITKILNWLKI